MRVAIDDDAVLFRAGVSSVLTDAGMTVTASVGSAEELPRAVERDPPDAAIVDIRMPPPHPPRPPPRSPPPTRTSACSCSPSTSRRITRYA
jgi:DNA-binding NarL/FixJ family response regulator